MYLRVNTALEVAIARQYARTNDFAFLDGFRNLGHQRPGVADAGRTAVADVVKADSVQVVQQAGFLQVVGDDTRSGCEAGLDPRLGCEAFFCCLFRDETSGDHDSRIGRVGATGDCRDQDSAVANLRVLTIDFGNRLAAFGSICDRRFQEAWVGSSCGTQCNSVLWPFWTSDAWLDRAHIEFQRIAVQRVGLAVMAPDSLFFRIRFDQRTLLGITAGQLKVTNGFTIDREDGTG